MNQTIKLTPQYFEYDNGLYSSEQECPNIYDKETEVAESIYHLFGNEFEYFMDCELFKGTKEDKVEYQKIIQDQLDAETKSWDKFTKMQGNFEL